MATVEAATTAELYAAIAALTGTTDDVITLDGTGTYQLTTNLAFNICTKTGGSITIQSSGQAIIRGNPLGGNFYLFRANKAGVSHSLTGIKFADHLRTDGLPLFLVDQNCGAADCVWEDVALENLSFDYNGANSMNGLIRTGNLGADMVLRFNGLTGRDLSVKFAGAGVGREGGLFSTQNNRVFSYFNGVNIDGFAVHHDAGYQFNGLLFNRGNWQFDGECSFKNITITGAQKASYGVIKHEPVGDTSKKLTIAEGCNLVIDSVHHVGSGVGADCYGVFNYNGDVDVLGRVEIKNCTNNTTSTNASFGILSGLSGGKSGANIVLHESGSIDIHDNEQQTGKSVGVVSVNSDKNATIDRIRIHDNTGFNTPLYHKASGNISAKLAAIYGNTSATEANQGGVAVVGNLAGSYITANLSGMTAVDNTSSGEGSINGVRINADGSSGTTSANVTATVASAILDNDGGDGGELLVASLSSGTHAVTVTGCCIPDGDDAVSGADTLSGTISSAPLLDPLLRLVKGSPCIASGSDLGLDVDVDGNPLPGPLGWDIGAVGYKVQPEAGFGPWATCDGILPLSAQPCKGHALPIGVGKVTAFPGVASESQINEAAKVTETQPAPIGDIDQFIATGIGTVTITLEMIYARTSLPVGTKYYPLGNQFISFENTGTTGRFTVSTESASATYDRNWVIGELITLKIDSDGYDMIVGEE